MRTTVNPAAAIWLPRRSATISSVSASSAAAPPGRLPAVYENAVPPTLSSQTLSLNTSPLRTISAFEYSVPASPRPFTETEAPAGPLNDTTFSVLVPSSALTASVSPFRPPSSRSIGVPTPGELITVIWYA